MSRHLQRRIEGVKKKILGLGGLVEQALADALRALAERDAELARQVMAVDARIDEIEIDIEEDCLAILALEQPVAFDLRYVVSVLKMNNDLERIGDLAGNLAEQALFLSGLPRIETVPFDLPTMATRVQEMLRQGLDAVVEVDVALADAVRHGDDEVDELYSGVFPRVQAAMRRDPSQIEQLVHHLNVARMLERIADHVSNIAEDVLYVARGEIVRHALKSTGRGVEPAR